MISRRSLLAGIGYFTAAVLAAAPLRLPPAPPAAPLVHGLIIDSFAGGGGASLGIEWALGRSPDIAINHDPDALAMHAANHPETLHLTENVWKVDPRAATKGQKVALLWASPDCRHHSKAKGGAPVSRSVRGLADVVLVWADTVQPAVICLENVEEWAQWGPLGEDGRRCPHRKGCEFARWVRALEAKGYQVDFREIRCCNYGSPTIRKRLFLVARRDGKPILWPEETHAAPADPRVDAGEMSPWGTAASDVIDWSVPCHSIFMTKAEARAAKVNVVRPLAAKTMTRIARGMKRYVLDRAEPFIVTTNHGGEGFRGQGIAEPFKTVTSARDAHGIIEPYLVRTDMTSAYQRNGVHSVRDPINTITTAGSFAAVSPFLAGVGGRMGQSGPRPVSAPYHTVTTKPDTVVVAPFVAYAQQGGAVRDALAPVHTVTASTKDQNQVIAAHLMTMRNSDKPFTGVDEATHTVTAGGAGLSIAAAYLAREFGHSIGSDAEAPVGTVTAGGGGKTRVVAAWMARHYGGPREGAPGHSADEPVSTIMGAGSHQMPVMTYLAPMQSQSPGADPGAPLGTVLADGNHHAVVQMPFVQAYYSTGDTNHAPADAPLRTITGKARFSPTAAVACAPPFTKDMEARARQVAEFLRAEGVWDGGEFVTVGPYVVVDIAMRMLTARELARAQGFPDYYDITAGGRLTDTAQRHKIGNSVCPHVAYHLVRANLVDAMAMPGVRRRRRAHVAIGPGLPRGGGQPSLLDKIAAGPS